MYICISDIYLIFGGFLLDNKHFMKFILMDIGNIGIYIYIKSNFSGLSMMGKKSNYFICNNYVIMFV